MENERVFLRQLERLTQSIVSLTKAIQPDSFHSRQVPALKRQTEALDFIRVKRQYVIDHPMDVVPQESIKKWFDQLAELLLST
jgi:hypothetical protein